MELSPKRRYQFVADLVNDLRQVAVALSPMPPTPPGRPIVDPNSPQPGPSGLFDALQEAKREINRGSGDAFLGTPAAVPPNAGHMTCPRCGTSLVPMAVFCPRCGMALAKQNHQASSNQQAQMQNRSLEKTQLAFPAEMKEAVAINTVGGVKVGNTAPAIPTSQSAQSQQVQLQQWRSAPPNGVGPHIMGPRGANYNLQPSLTSLLFKYRILILCIALLVIVLVVMVVAYGRP
jgi:uncharacterized Zn finger protein (UPF0148 family)